MELVPPPSGRGKRPKCGGTNRDGAPCKNTAGKGTDHVGAGNCANHGGATRNGRMHAAKIQAEREIAALNVEPVGDPIEQLSILAGQVLAWRDAMAEQVNGLSSLRYESHGEGSSGEQLRAEVALWERALDRCERVLTAMARLNIEDRLARITERQARIIEDALKATLGELGLDLETQDRARQSLGRHLRAA